MPWPIIDPGKLIHQIAIQRQVATTDVSGNVMGWEDFVTTWASIDPVRGSDVIRGGQDTTQLFLIVVIRWQDGILPNMRIVAASGAFVIQSIENPGERNVMLKLNCLQLGQNG